MSSRKIASNYLWQPEGFLRNPLVEVDADGCVVSVSTCAHPDNSPATEFYAGVLVPGFVNAHCHLELSYLRGAIAEGCGFAGFASAMGNVRGAFDAEQRLRAADAADAAMWAGGVAAVGDVANGDSTFGIKSRSRIKYHTFVEFFGLRLASAEAIEPLLQYPDTSLTPHSVYSVQDAPFRAICSQGAAPLSIHFMESPAERALFEGAGDLAAWYAKVGFECDFLHYGSPAERIVHSVPADRSVMLVHNCCVDEGDVDRLLNHFSVPLFWTLCPRSNHFISRLKPPVELLRAKGATICVGTDSLASNGSLSMLDELKMFSDVPLCETLGWATLNGAKALGMDADLGTVEPGKHCGLNVISGLDYERMMLTPGSRVERIL